MHRFLQEVPSAVMVLLPYILPVIGERMPLKVPLGPVSDEDELLKEPVKEQYSETTVHFTSCAA